MEPRRRIQQHIEKYMIFQTGCWVLINDSGDLNRPQMWAIRTVRSLSLRFLRVWGRSLHPCVPVGAQGSAAETPQMLPSPPKSSRYTMLREDENKHHSGRRVSLPFPLGIDQSYKHECDKERHEAGQINVSYPIMNGMQNRTYAQRSNE
jgi:hypothetical protein